MAVKGSWVARSRVTAAMDPDLRCKGDRSEDRLFPFGIGLDRPGSPAPARGISRDSAAYQVCRAEYRISIGVVEAKLRVACEHAWIEVFDLVLAVCLDVHKKCHQKRELVASRKCRSHLVHSSGTAAMRWRERIRKPSLSLRRDDDDEVDCSSRTGGLTDGCRTFASEEAAVDKVGRHAPASDNTYSARFQVQTVPNDERRPD